MATFLFVVSEHAGHVHATLRMARTLARRGHSVLFTGRRPSGERIRAQRLAFEPAEELEVLADLEPGEIGATPRTPARRWIERISELRRWSDRVVRRLRPDVVVFDPFMLLYSLPLRTHGVSAVALSANALLDPDPLIPPYTSGCIPSRGRWPRVRVAAAWAVRGCADAVDRLRDGAERLRSGCSDGWMTRALAADTQFPLGAERLNRHVRWDLCFRSVDELVLWPEAFDWPRAKPLRAGVRYVGASIDLERCEPAWDPAVAPRAGRLVYCSVGTVPGPDREATVAFVERVIEAVTAIPDCALVVACGRAVAPNCFRCRPNVRVVAEAPQLHLLRSASLHITHGGANSVKESILLGVPMLLYPRRADQPGNAARVVARGLGVRGRPSDGVRDITERASRVLNGAEFRRDAAHWRRQFLDVERQMLDVAALESIARRADRLPTVVGGKAI